jgi:hypothetical protein
MRHTIKDSLTGEMECVETPKGETPVGTSEGCTARSVGKTSHCLAVSYDSNKDFALAYIFTRKCPLPIIQKCERRGEHTI